MTESSLIYSRNYWLSDCIDTATGILAAGCIFSLVGWKSSITLPAVATVVPDQLAPAASPQLSPTFRDPGIQAFFSRTPIDFNNSLKTKTLELRLAALTENVERLGRQVATHEQLINPPLQSNIYYYETVETTFSKVALATKSHLLNMTPVIPSETSVD